MSNPKVPPSSIWMLVFALVIALISGVLPFANILSAYANHTEANYLKIAAQSVGALLMAFAIGISALRKARYDEGISR